jgi:prepilin-type processing-associated H-X9-DG protein
MSTFSAAFVVLCLGQAHEPAAADPRIMSIAPFVSTEVFAVVQLDLARADLQSLATRVFGEAPPGILPETKERTLRWAEALHKAGAKEFYLLFGLTDLPGSPLAVVPLAEGIDAGPIGRLLCGGANVAPPVKFDQCATIHGALVAGSAASVERVRREPAAPRPELNSAFTAFDGLAIAARLLILPSADSRRVLEEMVPNFPAELGGSPTTALSRGVLWAAVGLDSGPKPALHLVAGSQDEAAARALERLIKDVITFVSGSPQVLEVIPEFPKLVADFKPAVAGSRLTLNVDAQQAIALLDSASRPARDAAIRRQCGNNEKQIAQAIHNYIAKNQNLMLPPAFSRDKDGKPLLSWRVLVLPYLDQNDLYSEFHLDEPWDSPHNRALVAKMPAVYRCPSQDPKLASLGKTRYLAPRGETTVFRGGDPVSLRDITDGTSNTVLLVDVGDANSAIWTKPDDWPVEPVLDVEGVFTSHSSGTNIAFADGAVRFLHSRIKPNTLRALLTRAGNEVIDPNDF